MIPVVLFKCETCGYDTANRGRKCTRCLNYGLLVHRRQVIRRVNRMKYSSEEIERVTSVYTEEKQRKTRNPVGVTATRLGMKQVQVQHILTYYRKDRLRIELEAVERKGAN